MNYIIFDLEWNQAADLKTKTENSLEFEIIEIGAVKLNEKRELIDKFHELIKPQVFHKMNQVTGELLHLELEQLGNCRTFVQVAADFIRWCGTERVFLYLGNYGPYGTAEKYGVLSYGAIVRKNDSVL